MIRYEIANCFKCDWPVSICKCHRKDDEISKSERDTTNRKVMKATGMANGKRYHVDRDWYGRLFAAMIVAAKKRGTDRDKIVLSVSRAILLRERMELTDPS